MVVQEKKQKDEIRICVDLRKLNDACVHDSFTTPFTNEVLDNVGGWEAYSCTDGFSGYHQIKITLEDRIIAAFKDFTRKFLEIYFDDWKVFGLVKRHVASLRLMLDTCRRYQIALNLKKCLFYVPFRILLGHVVCRQGLMVDPAKIVVIINLEVPRSVKQLRVTLGHTGYYRKFIKGYAQITVPMEKILKKDATFYWNEECH
eukprot:PITA_32985